MTKKLSFSAILCDKDDINTFFIFIYYFFQDKDSLIYTEIVFLCILSHVLMEQYTFTKNVTENVAHVIKIDNATKISVYTKRKGFIIVHVNSTHK